MAGMRILTLLAIVFLLDGKPADTERDTPLIADAASAAVTSQRTGTLSDNYGNPELFIRYIIRRPPVLS